MQSLDDLVNLPGLAGNEARERLTNPAMPLETPAMTRDRVQDTARQQQTVQRIRAADLAARDIPTYTDPDGNIEAVRGGDGIALNKLDKRNNLAWDATGNPVKLEYGESGPPLMVDPMAAARDHTDKQGNKYKVADGLPWQWAGFDEGVKAEYDAAQELKGMSQAAAALGRKLSLDEHDLKIGEKQKKTLSEQLLARVPDLANLEAPDRNTVLGAIDAHYNTEAGFAGKDANQTTGWFGNGDLTPEAQARRAAIEAEKSSARDAAAKVFDLEDNLSQLRARSAAASEMRHGLATNVADAQLAKLGLTMPAVDNLSAAQPGMDAAGTPVAPDAAPDETAIVQMAAGGNTTGALGEIKKGLVRGWSGAMSSLGGLMKMVGAEESGAAVSEFWDETAQANAPGADIQTFDPANPKWYAARLPEVIAGFVPQLAVGLASGGASLPVQLASFGVMGGGIMAGSVYNDAEKDRLARGEDPETARDGALGEATMVGVIGAALESIPGMAFFSKNPAVRNVAASAIRRAVSRFGTGFVAEGATEVAQEVVSDLAKFGYRDDANAFDDAWNRYGAAGLLGGILGGSVNVAMHSGEDAAPVEPETQDPKLLGNGDRPDPGQGDGGGPVDGAPSPTTFATQEEFDDFMDDAANRGDTEAAQAARRDNDPAWFADWFRIANQTDNDRARRFVNSTTNERSNAEHLAYEAEQAGLPAPTGNGATAPDTAAPATAEVEPIGTNTGQPTQQQVSPEGQTPASQSPIPPGSRQASATTHADPAGDTPSKGRTESPLPGSEARASSNPKQNEAAKPAGTEVEKNAELIQLLEDVIATKRANKQAVPQATIDKLAQLKSGDTDSSAVFINPDLPGTPFTSENPFLPIKIDSSEAGLRSIDSYSSAILKQREALNAKLRKEKPNSANSTEIRQQLEDLTAADHELGRVERVIQQRIGEMPQVPFSIYQKEGKDGTKWMVQASEKRGPHDSSFDTRAEAEMAARFDRHLAESRKAARAKGAQQPPPLPKQEPKQPGNAETLETAKRVAKELTPDLKRIGVEVIDYGGTSKENASGAEFIDGKVRLDPRKLKSSMDAIRRQNQRDGNPSTPEDWLKAVLRHEALHVAQDKYAKSQGTTITKMYGDAPAEAFPADLMEFAGRAYGEEWAKIPEWAQRAEATRMVLEGRWTGTITEALQKIIRDLVNFIQRTTNLDGASDWLKQHVAEVERVAAGLQPAQAAPVTDSGAVGSKPVVAQKPAKATDNARKPAPVSDKPEPQTAEERRDALARSFFAEGLGAADPDRNPEISALAERLKVRYDGQIEVPGIERHQFTIEDPESPAHLATFIVRGEVTEEALSARIAEKQEQFSGDAATLNAASPVTHKGFPKEKRAQALELADAMIETGITTPEATFSYLQKIIGEDRARSYAKAMWATLVSADPELPADADWPSIFDPKPAEPEPEAEPEPPVASEPEEEPEPEAPAEPAKPQAPEIAGKLFTVSFNANSNRYDISAMDELPDGNFRSVSFIDNKTGDVYFGTTHGEIFEAVRLNKKRELEANGRTNGFFKDGKFIDRTPERNEVFPAKEVQSVTQPAPKAETTAADPTRAPKTLIIAGTKYPVKSLKEASEKAATIPPGKGAPLVMDQKGRLIGHIGEGGRVWPGGVKSWMPGTKALYDPAAEAEPASDEAAQEPPSRIAATEIAKLLTDAKTFDWRELFALSDRAFGGTQSEGKYTVKDAYDALELGVNLYLAQHKAQFDPRADAAEARETIQRIKREVLNRIPTQTKRTAEQDAMQQFSTPPHFAYVTNWVLNYRAGDVMMEPSVGIGGISVFAQNAEAKVIANELSDRRRAVVAETKPDHLTGENAEQLHAIFEPKIKAGELPRPTVVGMNPPFSNAAKSGARGDTMVGAQHMEEALKLLPEGGRLAAIVGEGMALDAHTFRPWWARIQKRYNVRANIHVDGKNYAKYGTTFSNRLIVIDKTGPTADPSAIVTGEASDILDLITLLEGVRNDRQSNTETSAQPSGARTPREDGSTRPDRPGAADDANPATGATPDPGRDGGQPGRDADTGRTPKPGDARLSDKVAGAVRTDGTEQQPGGRSVDGVEPAPVTPESGVTIGRRETPAPKQEENEDDVFSHYHPKKVAVPGAQPHPADLVESAAMASVEPPDPTYAPNLPEEVVKEGKLSEAQIENLVYAGQAHTQMLESGERRGYFIGDGTGVGKGRQISGIILDNIRQGRKRAIWVSKSSELVDDAKRDAQDIGIDPASIRPMKKIKKGGKIEGDGIVFTSYDTLKQGHDPVTGSVEEWHKKLAGKEAVSRIEQLAKWLGKDFDGVIVFDEAHMAGNAISIKGKRGTKNASKNGIGVVDLQKVLPNARVVYVSATGATEVENLSYADRLGIWGPNTPFSQKRDFFSKISAGGISAMEIVARDLKAMGLYLARSISYKGVGFDRLTQNLTTEQREIYNTIAESWQVALTSLDDSMGHSGANNSPDARSSALSAFWGAQQRFFNQLLTAMQMPALLTDMRKQLDAGSSLVLQIVNTNEASQDREIARRQSESPESGPADLEEMDLSPKDILLQYVQTSFPTLRYEAIQDPNNPEKQIWVPAKDSSGKPIEDPEAVAARDRLLDQVSLLQIPENPLEQILNQFGAENVAEVTGRSQRVVQQKQEDGSRKAKIERRTPASRQVEAKEFQDGKRRILVFSQAGGTGFSFHADRRAKNQEKRMHYLVQAGWRADAALQGFGRTHRTNQVHAPHYKLVETNIPGHKRFISTIARRLAQLGALTTGERKSAGQGMFTESDNMEGQYAEDAMKRLIFDLHTGRVENATMAEFAGAFGFTKSIVDETTGERETVNTLMDTKTGALNEGKIPPVPQFLNRLLASPLDKQKLFFDLFIERLENRITRAKDDGTYDPGTQLYKAARIEKVNDEVTYTHPGTSAATRIVEVNAFNPVSLTPFADVEKLSTEPITGYAKNKRSGRIYAMREGPTRTSDDGRLIPTFRRIGVRDYEIVPKSEIRQDNYDRVEKSDAEALWDTEMKAAPKESSKKVHFLVGAMLPIWDRIQLPNPKIYRFSTSDGETMLGVLIPEREVFSVKKRLGAKNSMTPEAIFNALLDDGSRIALANGWTLRRAYVSGENRIEVEGLNYNQAQDFTDRMGGMMERIQFKSRYFIPTEEKAGVETIKKIIAQSPVTSVNGLDALHAANPKEAGTDSTILHAANPMQNGGIVHRSIDGVWNRLYKGGRWFWEGTADVMRRNGFTELADSFWKQQDEAAKAFGQGWKPMREVLDSLSGRDQTQAKREFALYFRHKESKRPADAEAILKAASEGGKKLIAAWKQTALETGRILKAQNVHVRDDSPKQQQRARKVMQDKIDAARVTYEASAKTPDDKKAFQREVAAAGLHFKKFGNWRPIGQLGEDFFPRKINREVMEVLNDVGKDPAKWKQLVQDLIDNGNINDPSEADKFIKQHVFRKESDSDEFGNIERARAVKLPESWLEYEFNEIAPWYVTSYSRRIGQIAAYGQQWRPGGDLFDQVLETVPGAPEYNYTRQYIESARDAAYFTRANTAPAMLMKNLQAVATGTFLSNPFSAIRNLVSGMSQNLVTFGAGDMIAASYEAMTNSAARMTPHDIGVLRQDFFALFMEGRDDLTLRQGIRKAANAGLKWTGFNAAEDVVRTTAVLAALRIARRASKAILKNPDSRESLQLRAFLQRFDADPLRIATEEGKGPETEKFVRRAVNDTQGSYTFAQTPLIQSDPYIGFLTQFQKWGTQATRFLVYHTINPAIHGTPVKVKGPKGTVTTVNVRSFRPLLYAMAFAIGGGELLYWLKEVMQGRMRLEASLGEIEKAPEKLGLVLNRIVSDVIMAGTLGVLGDYGANFKEFASRGRFKNPFDPPGIQAFKNVFDGARIGMQQKTLTFRDLADLFGKQLPGIGFTEKAVRTLIDDPEQQAYSTRSTTRAAGRRMAEETGMPVRASFGNNDPIRTENSPFNNALETAVLSGNVAKTRQLVSERLAGKNPDQRKKLVTAMKAVVSANQPITVGGIASAENRSLFLAWMPKRLPAEQVKAIRELDARYWRTAAAAGLVDGPPTPKGNSSPRNNPMMMTGF